MKRAVENSTQPPRSPTPHQDTQRARVDDPQQMAQQLIDQDRPPLDAPDAWCTLFTNVDASIQAMRQVNDKVTLNGLWQKLKSVAAHLMNNAAGVTLSFDQAKRMLEALQSHDLVLQTDASASSLLYRLRQMVAEWGDSSSSNYGPKELWTGQNLPNANASHSSASSNSSLAQSDLVVAQENDADFDLPGAWRGDLPGSRVDGERLSTPKTSDASDDEQEVLDVEAQRTVLFNGLEHLSRQEVETNRKWSDLKNLITILARGGSATGYGFYTEHALSLLLEHHEYKMFAQLCETYGEKIFPDGSLPLYLPADWKPNPVSAFEEALQRASPPKLELHAKNDGDYFPAAASKAVALLLQRGEVKTLEVSTPLADSGPIAGALSRSKVASIKLAIGHVEMEEDAERTYLALIPAMAKCTTLTNIELKQICTLDPAAVKDIFSKNNIAKFSHRSRDAISPEVLEAMRAAQGLETLQLEGPIDIQVVANKLKGHPALVDVDLSSPLRCQWPLMAAYTLASSCPTLMNVELSCDDPSVAQIVGASSPPITDAELLTFMTNSPLKKLTLREGGVPRKETDILFQAVGEGSALEELTIEGKSCLNSVPHLLNSLQPGKTNLLMVDLSDGRSLYWIAEDGGAYQLDPYGVGLQGQPSPEAAAEFSKDWADLALNLWRRSTEAMILVEKKRLMEQAKTELTDNLHAFLSAAYENAKNRQSAEEQTAPKKTNFQVTHFGGAPEIILDLLHDARSERVAVTVQGVDKNSDHRELHKGYTPGSTPNVKEYIVEYERWERRRIQDRQEAIDSARARAHRKLRYGPRR